VSRLRPSAVRRIEIASSGIDEAMQLMGSDPFGSRAHVGLRVPTLSTAALTTSNGPPQWQNRYLFQACQYSVGEGSVGRIVGWRQLVTIGVELTVPLPQNPQGPQAPAAPNGKRAVEQLVTSPFWHFPDGDVSFHVTKMAGPNMQGAAFHSPPPAAVPAGTAFRWSMSPGLVWEAITLPAGDPFYVDLTAYRPPNAGRPWGQPLNDGHLKSITDVRTQWLTHGAWSSLDLGVEGPATIIGWISVAQTDPTSPLRAIPGFPPATFYPNGLSDEEQFLLNFPLAQYFRVGMSLVVEIGQRAPVVEIVPKESA
jgi:hypothetical protein